MKKNRGLDGDYTRQILVSLKEAEGHRASKHDEYVNGLAQLVLDIFRKTDDIEIVALFGYLSKNPDERTRQSEAAALSYLMLPENADNIKMDLGSSFLIKTIASLEEDNISELIAKLNQSLNYFELATSSTL